MADRVELSGWGLYPRRATRLRRAGQPADVSALLDPAGTVARGNGRAYGDAAIGLSTTIDMRRLDRLIAFDHAAGLLVAEAGLTLADIIDIFLPRGWFPAVTPGTKFVTLGGAIAADVHGKNHHGEGSFRRHVAWFDLLGPDGVERRCSHEDHAELFHWTIGGMGLTGTILRAAVRLRPVESAWIRQRTIATSSLAETMDAFEASADATYSVAWIDTLATARSLGRSILMLGEHARAEELPAEVAKAPFARRRGPTLDVPLTPPFSIVGGPVVRAFNALYYARHRRKTGTSLVPIDSFFYPLDAILRWNRIYGRRGFVQFQCVLPLASAQTGLTAMLSRIAATGTGSFLAVLKRMGAEEGPFSFPMDGYTLALDFPVGRRTAALTAELRAMTRDHGGRLYLAKDAQMTDVEMAALDPRGLAFARWRRDGGMAGPLRSYQSERLGL
ncbi:MAG: FAD-binding oxidoreductase [Rhizorhabdus sp.]|uniref:FAD-binding oxidoreductase n=1 Tax=Rhizorhabdus sp. TaxID=1968843 RepID=UPI001B5BCDAE|nr:FAD-binding oxidoreductase [Rhizorhabdus sp.]MBP8231427.1 FAD-binding oxidoreductase [Rhizorhabdus sp.]